LSSLHHEQRICVMLGSITASGADGSPKTKAMVGVELLLYRTGHVSLNTRWWCTVEKRCGGGLGLSLNLTPAGTVITAKALSTAALALCRHRLCRLTLRDLVRHTVWRQSLVNAQVPSRRRCHAARGRGGAALGDLRVVRLLLSSGADSRATAVGASFRRRLPPAERPRWCRASMHSCLRRSVAP
jgi:hypothetical protein